VIADLDRTKIGQKVLLLLILLLTYQIFLYSTSCISLRWVIGIVGLSYLKNNLRMGAALGSEFCSGM